MERFSDKAIEILNELHTERLDYDSEYLPLINSANLLAAYEDTEMEPDEIKEIVEITAEEAKKLFELIENAVVPETEKQERYCICGYGFLCERDEGDELQDILRKFKKFQQALPILQVRLIEPGDKGGIKVKGVEARYCPMCGGKLKEKK